LNSSIFVCINNNGISFGEQELTTQLKNPDPQSYFKETLLNIGENDQKLPARKMNWIEIKSSEFGRE
jgi:hypothetical protein